MRKRLVYAYQIPVKDGAAREFIVPTSMENVSYGLLTPYNLLYL